jgi:hypothetical protein
LDLSLQHILRRVGSNSYFIILHKGGTCWRWPNLRPTLWKRGGQNFCHPITNWDGPILGVTMQQKKTRFMWVVWNEMVAMNKWKARMNVLINQTY